MEIKKDINELIKEQTTKENIMSLGLTFSALRVANTTRLPLFRNSKGELAHPDGSDWSPAQWLQAMVGEVGEYANFRKKYERGDISEEEFMVQARKELADIQIYLDLLAKSLNVDLGEVTMAKFNEVSDRVGCDVKIVHGLLDEPVQVAAVFIPELQDGEESADLNG